MNRAEGRDTFRDASGRTDRTHPRGRMGKLQILGSFGRFLRRRKKYYLIPIVVVLVLLSLLLVLTEGSALAPFIYALF